MQSTKIERATSALVEAWRGNTMLDDFPDGSAPSDIEEGYAIQARLCDALGLTQVGWKLYASSRAALRVTRLEEPLIGRLFEEFMKPAAAAVFTADAFNMPTLEPEFLFRFSVGFTAREQGYSADDILDGIDQMALGVEIADSRFRNFKLVGMPGVAADNTGSGAYVTGPVVENWRALDLETVEISVADDTNEPLATGHTGPSRYVVRDVLVVTVKSLLRRGIDIEKGALVSTGTLTKPVPAVAGATNQAVFGELGQISLVFR